MNGNSENSKRVASIQHRLDSLRKAARSISSKSSKASTSVMKKCGAIDSSIENDVFESNDFFSIS